MHRLLFVESALAFKTNNFIVKEIIFRDNKYGCMTQRSSLTNSFKDLC